MIERQFIDEFPRPFPDDPASLLRQWSEGHQDILDRIDESIEQIIISHRITESEGRNLDAIGEQFGRIGERRGRGDEQYRAFLLSIVPSFAGRGTPTGLRFAIAAGVQAQASDIAITEYFDENAYSVTVGDWIRHQPTTVHEMADLADPSGVELRTPITYDYEPGAVTHAAGKVRSGLVITIPGTGVVHSASDATVTDQQAGFGAGYFDGQDPFGELETVNTSQQSGYGSSSYGESSYGGDGS